MSGIRPLPPLDHPLAGPAALEPPEEWAELRQACPVAGVTFPSGGFRKLRYAHKDIEFSGGTVTRGRKAC
ncbi:hypothetical protein [Streptomyces microflavus]|uniref:hypothetical protein n=1 Tax=Streptomyces microflavus TaxID=1919 RepID=UPI0036A4BCBB